MNDTQTEAVPMTHQEACERIGKTHTHTDGKRYRIIGVDPRPRKCTEGLWYVLLGKDGVRKYAKA